MNNKICPKNCAASCMECELEEKKIKAFDIIKDKKVNTENLRFQFFETNSPYSEYVKLYNSCGDYLDISGELLTEEEYNLLMEMF